MVSLRFERLEKSLVRAGVTAFLSEKAFDRFAQRRVAHAVRIRMHTANEKPLSRRKKQIDAIG